VTEPSVERLFDEFALAYVRGEVPDVRAYLERAGAEREALGRLIDRFLEAAPARQPTEEELVLLHASLERQPPVLVLRLRRRLTRQAVVGALVRALGLDPAAEAKVASYYHRLEGGLLDPEPVDRSVWDALGELLHADVRALAGVRPAPLAAEAAFRRADADAVTAPPPAAAAAAPAAPEEPPDEVDRLFTGAD
jgi:hypothetical protein